VEDVLSDFAACRRQYRSIRRVFLADGDALMADTDVLLRVLDFIRREIPECERVTCYASPASIRKKSEEDLRRLRGANLQMLYMGLESGHDGVLRQMRKGATAASIVEAAQKARGEGFALSVTAISGLGGRGLWREHAEATGAALSQIKPEYIGLLTLMVEPGTPVAQWVEEGSLELLSAQETLAETFVLLEHTDSEGSVFRMNHASNYLNLRGTLNRDKDALLARLREGMDGSVPLKSEDYRAL
jgi:radical SAM superfamily enzyme YgiQ (UPF0313 family)